MRAPPERASLLESEQATNNGGDEVSHTPQRYRDLTIAKDQEQYRDDTENAHGRVLHRGLAHLAGCCKPERCKVDDASEDQVGDADCDDQRQGNAERPELRETAKCGRGQQAGDQRGNEAIAPAQCGVPSSGADIFEKEVATTEADIGRGDAGHCSDCGERAILRRPQGSSDAKEVDALERELDRLPQT